MAKIAVIGSGISGLSAAAYIAQQGHSVDVYEKNSMAGGRARTFRAEGYLFDMGPSWYWMPGVFEKFFNDFDYKVADLYDLKLLDPAFEMVFSDTDVMTIPADYKCLRELFERIETGSAEKLDKFMKEAELKYKAGIDYLVYKPGLSLMEFAEPGILLNLFKLQVFSSLSGHINKYFSDARLRALMEFPALFLGAMPSKTPALYSLMNYAGLKLGTWYPRGGFGSVVEAMVHVGKQMGVRYHFNAAVEQICVEHRKVNSIRVNGVKIYCDAVVAAADYHHVESKLLDSSLGNYPEEYWDDKTFAPSCLIFYVGLNKKLDRLSHHTLFFDENLAQHSKEIYQNPQWPTKPLFYVCCPSKTDNSVAPGGHENLFFLMPIAPGLRDETSLREKYFGMMVERLEKYTGEKDIAAHIDFKRSYCVSDFINDYNSYKGNAYGLANTLSQTAVLRPKIINKKINNLFYAGQLTVPGPGVPPALISGKIAAQQLGKILNQKRHETII